MTTLFVKEVLKEELAYGSIDTMKTQPRSNLNLVALFSCFDQTPTADNKEAVEDQLTSIILTLNLGAQSLKSHIAKEKVISAIIDALPQMPDYVQHELREEDDNDPKQCKKALYQLLYKYNHHIRKIPSTGHVQAKHEASQFEKLTTLSPKPDPNESRVQVFVDNEVHTDTPYQFFRSTIRASEGKQSASGILVYTHWIEAVRHHCFFDPRQHELYYTITLPDNRHRDVPIGEETVWHNAIEYMGARPVSGMREMSGTDVEQLQ